MIESDKKAVNGIDLKKEINHLLEEIKKTNRPHKTIRMVGWDDDRNIVSIGEFYIKRTEAYYGLFAKGGSLRAHVIRFFNDEIKAKAKTMSLETTYEVGEGANHDTN